MERCGAFALLELLLVLLMLRTEIIQIAKVLHECLDALEVHLSLAQIPICLLLRVRLRRGSSHWQVREAIASSAFDERQALRTRHLGHKRRHGRFCDSKFADCGCRRH